ncbi:hypothetical protein L6V77_10435 [Myxococcota bacterium]|nr:hypothetical protein [Myxococcota bacterium]
MRWFHGLALGWGLGFGACGGDEAADESARRCADAGPPACTPLYPATFDEIYDRRLAPTCASASACHGAGGQGGLSFTTADEAYAALVEAGRVVPGAAACGVLVERLTTTAAPEMMPPGAPLSAEELCAIQTWIAAGAAR